jgi:CheY-like chemotaxis protein
VSTESELGADESAGVAVDPPPLGTERIMLVDDEAAVADVERQMLEALGYAVTTFTGGPEALAAFTAAPDAFDVVVTDQTMPPMTGLELAAHVRALRPRTPVILATGFSPHVDARSARKFGVQGFLAKPYKLSEVAAVLREALDAAATEPGA